MDACGTIVPVDIYTALEFIVPDQMGDANTYVSMNDYRAAQPVVWALGIFKVP